MFYMERPNVVTGVMLFNAINALKPYQRSRRHRLLIQSLQEGGMG